MSKTMNYGSVVLYPEPIEVLCGTPCIAGNNSDNKIFYSNFYDPHNSFWPKLKEVPGAYNVQHKPSIAVFKDRLYVFWTNPKGYVYFSHYNGDTWSSITQYYKWWSNASPALEVYKGKLYAIWNGYYNDGLYWSETSDGDQWSTHVSISLGNMTPQSTRSISTAVYRDKMYMMWRENDKLRYGWFNGSKWSGVNVFEKSDALYKYWKYWILGDEINVGAPALVVVNDELHVIYNSGLVFNDAIGLYSSIYSVENNSWSAPKFVDLITGYKNQDYFTKNISSPINFRNSVCMPFIQSDGNFIHKTYKSHQGRLYHEPLNYHSKRIQPILGKTSKLHEFDAIFALTDEMINAHLKKLFIQQWNRPIREASLPWKLDTHNDVSPITPSIQDAHTVKSQGRNFYCPKIEIIKSTSTTNPESEVLLKINLFEGKFYPDGINNRSTAIDIENWAFKISAKLGIKKLEEDLEHEVYVEFKDKLNDIRRSYGDIDVLFLDLQSADLFGDVGDVTFGKSVIEDRYKKKFIKAIRDYIQSIRSHPHGHPHGWIFSGIATNREIHRTIPDKGEIYFTKSAFAVHAEKDKRAIYWLLMSNNSSMPNIVETGVADHYLIDKESNGTFHFTQSSIANAIMNHIHRLYGGDLMFDVDKNSFLVARIQQREFSVDTVRKKSVYFCYKNDKVICNIDDSVSSAIAAKNYWILDPAATLKIKSVVEYDIKLSEDKIYFAGRVMSSNLVINMSGTNHTEQEFYSKYPVNNSKRQEARKQFVTDVKIKLESENERLLGGVNHAFLQIAQPAHTKYNFSQCKMTDLFQFKVNLNAKL